MAQNPEPAQPYRSLGRHTRTLPQSSDPSPDAANTRAGRILARMDDERPPICPFCGVTMVPTDLSARDDQREGDWVCLECEETGEVE